MIGDMLEARTKEGPILVFGWFNAGDAIRFIAISRDGTIVLPNWLEVSADWHFDPNKGWLRDFGDDGEDAEE